MEPSIPSSNQPSTPHIRCVCTHHSHHFVLAFVLTLMVKSAIALTDHQTVMLTDVPTVSLCAAVEPSVLVGVSIG